MVESVRVRGTGRICVSIEKLCGRVPEKGRISVSTEKRWNPGKYREKVESVQGSKKLSRRIPKRSQMSVSIEKW